MNKSKIQFYHNYIIKDINRLEDRANKYLQRRSEYIAQKFDPINKRIEEMKQQSKHFKEIRDFNDSMIEGREDIKQLRSDIQKYKESQEFYQKHLDEMEKILFETEQKNMQMRELIENLKSELLIIKKQHILQSVEINYTTKHLHQVNHTPSINLSQFKSQASKQAYKTKLPVIHTKTIPPSAESIESLKQQLRQKITEFNNMDCLYKDCFETRKIVIQRMIGQLQSKLVKNKKIFVKTCELITTNQQKQKLTFQEFKQLDADEIFTLLISFPLLSRKFVYQLNNKRQDISQYSNLLK